MNTVVIVAPQFPPCNLAAVHRTRLFAHHLPEFGWEPIVVMVRPKHYETELDWNLAALVPDDLRVERVGALPVEPIRIVGSLGIRAFVPFLRRVLRLIDEESVDFLYLPIPPHFTAPLGRVVHALRGMPYGIDYIDPWVHVWPGSETPFTKHWISRKLGEFLEPIAVKNASLITGVDRGYFEDVLERNPHLRDQAVTAAMPYGGEEADHRAAENLDLDPYLFDPDENRFQFLYAGALLPKAVEPLRRVFQALSDEPEIRGQIQIQFVGTGTSPDDPEGYQVKPLAEEYGLWGDVVFEHPARIPYLDVLVHLEATDGVFILGSTEPHYTPSKVYQSVLSGKPILAVLHQESSACDVLRSSGAGQVLTFDGAEGVGQIERNFADQLRSFHDFAEGFEASDVNRSGFEQYSARSVTRKLADALDRSMSR